MKPLICLLALSVGFSQERLPLPATGNVTLPLGEYNRLVDQASKQPKNPETPPSPFSINRTELLLEANGDAARGKIRLEGEALVTGPIPLPLLSNVTLLDARQTGKSSLPILRQGSETTALIDGPGPFAIELDAIFAMSIEPGRATLRIPPINTASTRLP